MRNFISKYGKGIRNPLILPNQNSIKLFLDNMITFEGCHIIYNKLNSIYQEINLIEHYQIFSFDRKKDDVFIAFDEQKKIYTPPYGYLFKIDKLIENGLIQESSQTPLKETIDYYNLKTKSKISNNNLLENIFAGSFGTSQPLINFPKDLIEQKFHSGETIITKSIYQRIVNEISQI